MRNSEDEPSLKFIQELASHGLDRVGERGPIDSLGVPRHMLPSWDELQIVTAQLGRLPLLDTEAVDTKVVIGPRARRPLTLDIPLLVADMAFGSLSEEAKIALSLGAEKAGTGICSGEAGALPEELLACRRHLVQMGPARWGFSFEKLRVAQAFHIKVGQAAKTGTGGHLVGSKVHGRVAEMHEVAPGTTTIAPSRFVEWTKDEDFREFFVRVREETGGIPIGIKMSAQHIEDDIDVAVRLGVDYIILDGRGGGTAAAPLLFRDHIGVPTIPALARARRRLDQTGNSHVSLIVTGGLRTPADFIKALALGADAIALGSAALQAIGCTGERLCHTDTCPAGIATQQPHLRAMLKPIDAGERLARFLTSAVSLMKIMSRACGHDRLSGLSARDLTSWKREMSELAGVRFAGVQET